MSVSASAQENVLSETWGQKLDLTIPSLEMQSTLALDSKVKQGIMRGWTCCYRNELINAVHQEHSQKLTESSLRASQKRYEYSPQWELIDPPSNRDWTLFVFLQFADVWSTYHGLKYDCVEEANPIFGKDPSVDTMFFYKIGVLTPAIEYDRRHGNLNKRSIQGTNTFMFMVLANNLNVKQRAKRYCNKK